MEEKKGELLNLMQLAIEEMEQKQTIILLRGDLLHPTHAPLYEQAYLQLKQWKQDLMERETVYQTYRNLQSRFFMKEETFCMNLFETRQFPCLFTLFEFE